jgi:3-oxoacyl-[acyl-carrier protein] reductase
MGSVDLAPEFLCNASMFSLSNKKIFVTGGSRGIGAACVRYLDECGASVVFSYSASEASSRELIESLKNPTRHKAVFMKLPDASSIEEAAKQVLEFFGGEIDGLVNNAGITKDQLFLRMKPEDFDQVVDVNLKGSFLVTKAFVRNFLQQRRGSIVNVSSVIGHTGNMGQANYAASKGGLELMSRSLAQELGSRGVRVNCVAPGFVETDMTHELSAEHKEALLKKIPLGRVAQASEIAKTIAFLLSDEASYLTGATLHVNGGLYMG